MPSAILAAAGRGARAQTHTEEVPKQFRDLAGRALLLWSVDALVGSGCTEIVVVVPPDLVERARDLIEAPAIVVAGGTTRQESVGNGLAHVSTDAVVVHDAARPLVTPELIGRVVAALEDADAAIAAVPVGETVKKAEAGYVISTIDRTSLWLAQTPQAFRTEVLSKAHEQAGAENFQSTDDAQLIERYGGRVVVVESDPRNLKITHSGDFPVAEALIAGRRS